MATTVQSTRIPKGLTLALTRPALRVTIMLCTDIATLFLAVLAAFSYWALVNPTIPRQHSAMYLVVALSIAAFAVHGLYPGIGLNAVQYLRRMFRCITFSYLLLTASMVLVKDWWLTHAAAFSCPGYWRFSWCLPAVGCSTTSAAPRVVGRAGHHFGSGGNGTLSHSESARQPGIGLPADALPGR